VAAWDQLSQPYRVAYTCFRQAEALMASAGNRDQASTCLRRAADITGSLGARPLDSEVKALAKRARLDLAPAEIATAAGIPTPAQQLGLTPREVEVLALVAAGHSNSEIAQRLFISPKTASVHVSHRPRHRRAVG
jgi:DNA-binding NarL/FixJ family response regulator